VKKAAKWGVVIVLALAGLAYALLLVGVWAIQDRLMFGRRTNEIVENPSARNWSYEEVWVDVAGGRTCGWWIPVPDARGTVLFSHGSGHNISNYLEDVVFFRDLGLSVLLYDYGGYGLSTGEPSEARCCADARAMWDHLVTARGIPPEKIVLAGSSMGGGVTAELATQVSPAAVLFESTFTSIPDTLAHMYPFIPAQWVCRIQFRNIDKVGRIRCPVLISHSRQDTVVPFAEAEQLYQQVSAPKMFVEIQGSHHGGKFESRAVYAAALNTFFSQHVRF